MKWAIVVLLFILVAFGAWYVLNAYQSDRVTPREVKNSDDYKLAIAEATAEARGLRWIEFGIAAASFSLLGWLLAMLAMPRPSWLRNSLVALATFVGVFVGFGVLMESVFHDALRTRGVNPSIGMPLSAMEPLVVSAAGGIALVFAFGIVFSLVHRWSVGR